MAAVSHGHPADARNTVVKYSELDFKIQIAKRPVLVLGVLLNRKQQSKL
tara:strand:- start:100 stop:246 length:147 start_codon:yes stop_codon:yes gene_type:complete